MKQINLSSSLVILTLITVLGLIAVLNVQVRNSQDIDNNIAEQNIESRPTLTKDEAKETKNTESRSSDELLLYLIEEEKLAHDVYSYMYQKYGANVFGNILKSESSHQEKVLSLLKARNIADPRSPEVGVFQNQELQTLYNQLVDQGSISAVEAYKVGVIIEEKDIADINEQLAIATEQDVISTLEELRRGSENHLRAFNRQLR